MAVCEKDEAPQNTVLSVPTGTAGRTVTKSTLQPTTGGTSPRPPCWSLQVSAGQHPGPTSCPRPAPPAPPMPPGQLSAFAKAAPCPASPTQASLWGPSGQLDPDGIPMTLGFSSRDARGTAGLLQEQSQPEPPHGPNWCDGSVKVTVMDCDPLAEAGNHGPLMLSTSVTNSRE